MIYEFVSKFDIKFITLTIYNRSFLLELAQIHYMHLVHV